MATKRVKVKGIEHGLSGYTNYECRCRVCTEANSAHSRRYRERRYAGDPLCTIPRCDNVQSRAHNNGLCYSHATAAIQFRTELEEMNRLELKRLIRNLGLGISVLKRYTDDDIREAIREELGADGMARAA